jgi:triacylglycerol lipase
MNSKRKPTVVLIHGWLGFRRLLWWEYFRDVRPLLENMGFDVIAAKTRWGGRLALRGRQLAEQLEPLEGPLHLIAHSMGGIDARYFIRHLEGHKKVTSLTTLSSPHRGSFAADYMLSRGFSWLWPQGILDLTIPAMIRFNRQTPDHGHVIYRSYSACRPEDQIPWLVRRLWRIIAAREGENDSQVSIRSAIWGEHLGTLEADHFELIGLNLWLNPFRKRTPFDHLALYRTIGQWILEHEASGHPDPVADFTATG